MKYFISRGPAIRADIAQVISDKDYEVSKELALGWYKSNAGRGNLNLLAIPNFNKGVSVTIRRGTVRLWGEDVSDSECFRRRLEGILHTDIIDSDKEGKGDRNG